MYVGIEKHHKFENSQLIYKTKNKQIFTISTAVTTTGARKSPKEKEKKTVKISYK